MALDEQKQLQLADIIPVGTNSTNEQKSYRKLIYNQQIVLDKLNSSKIEHQIDKRNKNELLENLLKGLGVVRYGITPIIKKYLFKNAKISEDEINAIVIVIPMFYNKMKDVPSIESATEIIHAYKETGKYIVKLTEKIQKLGFQATGHHPLGDLNDYHHILMPPHAENAGIGEKGRTGLFIDYKYGPLVRLGIVTTSMKLKFYHKKIRGITEFCKRCLYCVDKCPPKALPFIKLGSKINFKINGERCIKYFEKHYSCGRCIFHCVLAKPTTGEIKTRIDRIEAWYENWIVSGEYKKIKF